MSDFKAMDRIIDFDADEGDRIELDQIDANPLLDGDQAFVRVGAFSGAAGECVITFDGLRTRFLGDVNGDGVADFGFSVKGDQLATIETAWML
jgi:hypothetical protein